MWKSNKKYHLLWQRGFFLMDHLRETLAEEAGDGFLQMYGDLTYGQSKAFRAVFYMMDEHPEGVTLKALSKRLRTSAAATSEMVDVLEKKGVLSRFRSKVDRRAVSIRVSERMAEELVRVNEFYAERVRRLTAVLQEDEMELLVRVFEKLYREAQEVQASRD